MQKSSLKQRLLDANFWLRLPFMLLFYVLLRLANFVLGCLVLVQLVFRLITGKPTEALLSFNAQLTSFTYEAWRYLTFNSETKPFPFASWPEVEAPDADPYLPAEQIAAEEESLEEAEIQETETQEKTEQEEAVTEAVPEKEPADTQQEKTEENNTKPAN